MNTVTVSNDFALVIPKKMRDRAGLRPGTKLQIVHYGNRIELVPIKPAKELQARFQELGIKLVVEADN
jgi:AbrB family looped-hinge helix DNA binding protein